MFCSSLHWGQVILISSWTLKMTLQGPMTSQMRGRRRQVPQACEPQTAVQRVEMRAVPQASSRQCSRR